MWRQGPTIEDILGAIKKNCKKWVVTGSYALSLLRAAYGLKKESEKYEIQRVPDDYDFVVDAASFVEVASAIIDLGYKGDLPGPKTTFVHLTCSGQPDVDLFSKHHEYYRSIGFDVIEVYGMQVIDKGDLAKLLKKRLEDGESWEGIDPEKKKKAERDLLILANLND